VNAKSAKGTLMNENISFANEQQQRAFLVLFVRNKKNERNHKIFFQQDSKLRPK